MGRFSIGLVAAVVALIIGAWCAWRARRKFTAVVAAGVAVLLIGGWIGWYKLGQWVVANDCGFSFDGFDLPSPRGDKVAILEDWVCAGGFGTGFQEYRVRIQSTGETKSKDDVVFRSNGAPKLTWTGDDTLDIHIFFGIPNIGLSLHKVDNTIITYSIAKELSRENNDRKTKEYEERMKDNIENRIATFTGNKDKDFETLKRVVETDMSRNRRFEQWASENAAKFDEP